jgi:ankyrin repeat protein
MSAKYVFVSHDDQLDQILEFLRAKLPEYKVTIGNAIMCVMKLIHGDFEYGLETGGDRSSEDCIAFVAEMTRMVNYLIKVGASDIDATDDREETPLFFAVANNLPDIANILIAAGCDVNRKNLHGESALHVAARIQNGCTLVRLLLASGANFKLRSTMTLQCTPMCSACLNKDILQEFIDAGADVNEPCDVYGSVPLHSAAEFGNATTIALLLRYGARIDSANKFGITPLMMVGTHAYEHLRVPALSALIVAGASTDALDFSGHNALHWSFCPEMLVCLVAVGCNVNQRNFRNKCPSQSIFSRPLAQSQLQTMLIILFAAGAEFDNDFRNKLLHSTHGSEWQKIFDNPAPVVDTWQQRFDVERKRFSILIFRNICTRAFSICCALQSLQLPALLTLAILDAYFEPIHGSYHLVSMYTKWKLIATVKHKI